MPKQKSSASSATRKKHAKKAVARQEALAARAVGEEEEEEEEQQEEQEDVQEAQEVDRKERKGDEEGRHGQHPPSSPGRTTTDRAKEDGSSSTREQNPSTEPSMTTSHPTDERAAKKTTTTTTTTATATTATSTVKDPSSGKRQAPLKPPSSSKQHSQQQQQQQKKAQKKQSKKHKKGEAPPPPRKKQYIPPVKPEGQLDPVDIYGLGITGTGYERVPAERVVTLRLLNKKDAATVEKALDELSSWITTGGSSSERAFTDLDETHLQHVAEALPVWVYHLPRLLSHSSRRIRLVTANIQGQLLHAGSAALVEMARPILLLPATLEHQGYLASQITSACDVDRQVRAAALTNWQCIRAEVDLQEYTDEIADHLTSFILECSTEKPHRAQSTSKLPDELRMKLQEEQDAKSNQLAASLEAFAYLLRNCTSAGNKAFESAVSAPELWRLCDSSVNEASHVRRAVWTVLSVLTDDNATAPVASLKSDHMRSIAPIVMASAFREKDHATQNAMWETVVPMLEREPEVWHFISTPTLAHDEPSASDAADSPQDDSADAQRERIMTHDVPPSPNVIAAFFEMVQSAFFGNPLTGYKGMLAILKTIPSSVLPFSNVNLEKVFAVYWASYTSRSIEIAGAQGVAAFSLVFPDLLLFASTRVEASDREAICFKQLNILWNFYIGHSTAPSRTSSLSRPPSLDAIRSSLDLLAARFPSSLPSYLDNIGASLDVALQSPDEKAELLWAAFEALSQAEQPLVREHAYSLEVGAVAKLLPQLSNQHASAFVTRAIQRHGLELLQDSDLRATVSSVITSSDALPFQLLHGLLQATTPSDNLYTAVWEAIRRIVSAALESQDYERLLPFLEADLPAPQSTHSDDRHSLDRPALQSVTKWLQPDGQSTPVHVKAVQRLLRRSVIGVFTTDLPAMLLSAVAQTYRDAVAHQMSSALMGGEPAQSTIGKCLDVLSDPEVTSALAQGLYQEATVAIFEASFVLGPAGFLEPITTGLAQQIWDTLKNGEHGISIRDLAAMIASRLGQSLLESPHISVQVLLHAVQVLEELPTTKASDIRTAFLPDEDALYDLAKPSLEASPFVMLGANSLLLELLVFDGDTPALAKDRDSVLSFSRALLAWTAEITEHRFGASQHAWLIPHCLLLKMLAENASLGQEDCTWANIEDLSAMSVIMDRVCRYLMSVSVAELPSTWHRDAVTCLKDEIPQHTKLPVFLSRFMPHHGSGNTASGTNHLRVVYRLLALALHCSDVGAADAEQWLEYSRSLQKADPARALSIAYAAVPFCSTTSSLGRYQSEVASTITGVRDTELGEKGLSLLRLLAVLTCQEGLEVQLPPHRVIFLLQTLQKMLVSEGSETEVSEEVQAAILYVATSMIPAIQGLNGSHWDFLFDLAESILECAPAEDHIGVHIVCHFLSRMQACAASSKDFSAEVSHSILRLARMVFNHIAGMVNAHGLARGDAILQVALPTLAEIPGEITTDVAKALLPLGIVVDPAARYAAYSIARSCIRKQSEDLVLVTEVGRDREEQYEDNVTARLPPALFNILGSSEGTDFKSSPAHIQVRQLLAWLLIFDHFDEITTAIRNAYLDELRRNDSVSKCLLPLIFSLNEVTDRSRGIDLSAWSVQDFYLEDTGNGDNEYNVGCLAAHVYYRALQTVPSLIKSEWDSYKNKQLSHSVSAFTARYFSPLLIESELRGVQDEASLGPNDENMVVKVLPNVNEVKASYLVDEHPMEITVRVPPEFPLQAVVVREGKKVGVPEPTWRAWMLNIQLVISSHSGSIADAMSLFKVNAARHFEGVEACAICYSVISVNDRSMPTKRCRTCKNLFHPSCLYKWFSTSHGSTCPLCRSLF